MCYNGHKQSKGETLVIPFPEYPRPALRRDSFLNLNGLWSYAITADEALPNAWDGEILVPYSPETAASGVRRTLQPNQWLHYQRMFTPPDGDGGRVLLHFGAVDNDCVILVNHREVGRHSGGYWPFSLDITDYLQDSENTLHVAVQDASDCGIQARGKQKLTPGGMFYPAQSGIWQTVWLERVPDCYVQELTITPDVPTRTVRFAVSVSSDCLVTFRVTADGREVALARNTAVHHQASVTLKLPEEALRCWSPDDPLRCGNFAAGGQGGKLLRHAAVDVSAGCARHSSLLPERSADSAQRSVGSGLLGGGTVHAAVGRSSGERIAAREGTGLQPPAQARKNRAAALVLSL